MKTARWRAAATVAALAVFVSAACGSTVQHDDAGGAAGAGADVLAEGRPSETGLGSPATRPEGTAAPSARAPSSSSVSISPSGARANGAVGDRQPGPGVTDKTVAIGVVYQQQATLNSAGAQFGAKGLVYGDLLAQQAAVAEYINSQGGVAGGRKITLVAYDATSNSDPQAICSHWTEDNKVFAGIYPGGRVESEVWAACMANHKTVFIQTPLDPGDQKFLDTYGRYLYAPSALEATHMGRIYAEGLAEQGFFSGGRRVGLLYYDMPSMRSALENGIKPALAKRGVTVRPEHVYAIKYPEAASDYGEGVSAVQTAQLRFAADGVDRVMFLDSGGGLAFFFMASAQSQGYRPRYGLQTGSSPSFLDDNYDRSQLSGAIGVGWMPQWDVNIADIPETSQRALCRRIMDDAGQPAQSQADLAAQYDICASFFLLRDGLNRAAAPNAAAFEVAVEAMTDAPNVSAASLGDGYGPRKHWGAVRWAPNAYNDGCSCFKYTGAPRPI